MAVIGTAGHIDHGKTALVRALTGIDTDRLKEEKARGITIELGFAHLALPSGRTVGVVDVPGHEKFVRTMVAGAVGIDLVVLVVAADEGVMPQTREHLEICLLLGIARAVIALTKIDLVDAELLALAEADVVATLRHTAYARAPIVRCSTRTETGLDALRAAIDAGLDSPVEEDPLPGRVPDSLLRLPIDRTFTLKGFGSIVTGTLWSGSLRVGDDVALPEGERGKVRGIQIHGQSVERADAGTRVAVNVALPHEALPRGATLGRAGELEAGRVFDAQIRLLDTNRRALRPTARVLLHAGTTQTSAIVRSIDRTELLPGEVRYVEIESEEPLVLLPGDSFVLRGTTPQKGYGSTLGGGVVLRVLGPRSRRGHRTTPELLQQNLVAQRGDRAERVRLEIERAGERGIDLLGLRRRVPGVLDAALATLRSRGTIVRHDKERDAYVSSAVLGTLVDKARAIVEQKGEVPREALRAHVTRDVKLLHLVVERLLAQGGITADRDRLVAPRAVKDDGSDALVTLLCEAALEPPRHAELPALLGWTQARVDKALSELARDGRIVRTKELSFAAEVVDALAARLRAHLEQHPEIDAQGWKALTGVSRKFATPLAEHFDAVKLTLRVGDVRRLRR